MEDILREFREATGRRYDGNRYDLGLQDNAGDQDRNGNDSDVEVPIVGFESSNESDSGDDDGDDSSDDDMPTTSTAVNPWSEDISEVFVEKFMEDQGPVHDLSEEASPWDYFYEFIPEEFYQHAAEQTNLYATQRQQQTNKQDKYWKPVTVAEIKLYFNINIIMGIHDLPEYWMIWSSDDRLGVKGISDLMGKSRYEKIHQYFHLNDSSLPQANRTNPDFDPLHKVRPLLDLMQTNIARVFKPGKNISIDEAVIAFNGRLTFKQYIKGKPNPWGIKVWCTADAATGYLLDFDIYTGRVAEDMPNGAGYHVMMKLGARHLNKLHHIYFDNYFASVKLAQDLLNQNTYSCSTIRTNRKGWPDALKPRATKKMKRGDIKIRQQGNRVATVWRDKRHVAILSTNTTPGITILTTVSRRGVRGYTNVDIPSTVATYNQSMGGVDRFDQLSSYYPVGRRSVKWWRYLFSFLLQTALVNSYILYSTSHCPRSKARTYSQIFFRLAISDSLVNGNIFRKRKSGVQQPATLGVGTADPLQHRLIRMTGSKRACYLCSKNRNFTNRGRARETVYGCNICQVRLCKGDCFARHHEAIRG